MSNEIAAINDLSNMSETPMNLYDKTDKQIARALMQAIEHANIFVAVYDSDSDSHELFYRENGKLKGTLIKIEYRTPLKMFCPKLAFDIDKDFFVRMVAKGRERYMAGEKFKEIDELSSNP